MTELRYPHLPPECVSNRFGWRFDGAGRQLPRDADDDAPDLLPEDRFSDPRLKVRPPYVNDRMSRLHIDFLIGKGCAGLAHEYRESAEAVRQAMFAGEFSRRQATTIRWALDGMRHERFTSLHSIARLTIEELARMIRNLYPAPYRPWRSWLNQWAADPGRAMPTEEGASWKLEEPDELIGIDLREISPEDERRIDEDGITYVKLNGIVYFMDTARIAQRGTP